MAKSCLLDTAGPCTQTFTAAVLVCKRPNQPGSQHRKGGACETTSPAEELLVSDGCWESQFSSGERFLVHCPCLCPSECPCTHTHMGSSNWTHWGRGGEGREGGSGKGSKTSLPAHELDCNRLCEVIHNIIPQSKTQFMGFLGRNRW